MRRQEFVGNEPGVTEYVTSDEPIDIFELIVTDDLIDVIVENTNSFIQMRTCNCRRNTVIYCYADLSRISI